MQRKPDGSAGDIDYATLGTHYARYRQPEPAIAAQILRALGDAQTILNVGAGAGSYEPLDRTVTPVEPSASMRAQRPPNLAPAIDAFAESLPFADKSFDASMSTQSIHQWSDLEKGLSEMRRVTRGPIVLFVSDPDLLPRWWLNAYAPDVLAAEARRFPPLSRVARALGGKVTIEPVPIPLHCADGFNEAYYGRPEMLLDPNARLSCSSWSFVSAETQAAYVDHLRGDLESGAWDRKYGALRRQFTIDGSLVLVVAH